MAILALAGGQNLISILNYSTFLYRAHDRPAIQWVAEHVPADETVLINPFFWGYNLYAGNDGGYWITPLAGRRTAPAPVLYGTSPDRARLVEIAARVTELAGDAAALRAYLQAQDIQFVFLGVRGGVLSPTRLADSGLFEVRYAQDGAWVFEVKP
jgi:hypothetical protein